MSAIDEAFHAWMQSERVPGVAFSLNESVLVVEGEHAGTSGAVVSLVSVEPDVCYLVELSSGQKLELVQSALIGLSSSSEGMALAELQRWYASQCDGTWEHSFGIKIDTLDNPGWVVRVDLRGTHLAERPFEPISEEMDGPCWVACRIADGQFEGACGPNMLARVARIFVNWAEGPKKSA